MQVVDHQQGGAGLLLRRDDGENAVYETKIASLKRTLLIVRAVSEQRPHVMGQFRQHRLAALCGKLVELRGKELGGDSEPHVALELSARSAQYPEPHPAGAVERCLVKARLSEAGVTLDQERLAVACVCALERRLDCG
jgi:hypothetical protein